MAQIDDDIALLESSVEDTPVSNIDDDIALLEANIDSGITRADEEIGETQRFAGYLRKGYDLNEFADPRMLTKIGKEIAKEKTRRANVMAEWEKPEDAMENVKDTWGVVGGIAKNLATFSTTPSKPWTEYNAKRNKEGEPDLDIEQTLGSVVNLAKSMWPGGQTPGDALSKFRTTNPQGSRKMLKDLYSRDIINEHGLVDIESLEYSDIPRWMQNELTALWAAQRTGINNVPLFKKIISSRLGVLSEDEMLTPTAKRLAQMVDGMLFNIPSKGIIKARMGMDPTGLFQENQNKVPGAHEAAASIGQQDAFNLLMQEPVYDKETGKFLVYPATGGIPAVIPNYDPSLPQQERYRLAAKALLDDTIQRLEYQAMEAGPQLVDPSILVGVGAAKAGAGAVAKLAGKTGARVAAKAGSVLPTGGLVTAAARSGAIPLGSKLIAQTAATDSALGTAVRFADRALTQTALVAGAAGLGAPTGAATDAAITGALISMGLSPLHVVPAMKPTDFAVSNANRDALREILNAQGNTTKMSKYSKRFLQKEMQRLGLTSPTEYVHHMQSIESLEATLPDSLKTINESETSPIVVMEVLKNLASDPKWQKQASEAMKLFDNMGRTWEGGIAHEALMKTLKQQEEHAQKVKADSTQTGRGASSAPLTSMLSGSVKETRNAIEALPARVLNDPDAFRAWLEGNVAGRPDPSLPTLSADPAKTALGLWDATDRTNAYLPLAQMVFVTATALKDQAPLLKTTTLGKAVNQYKDLVNIYRDADPQELLNFVAGLPAVQTVKGEENALTRIIRHSEKGEPDRIAPAYAATKLAEDLDEAVGKVAAKQAELQLVQNAMQAAKNAAKEKAGKDFASDPDFQKRMSQLQQNKDIVLQEISDMVNGTQLGKIYQHSKDMQKKIVTHQGDLAKAVEEDNVEMGYIGEGIDAELAALKLTPQHERMIRRSRALADETTKELEVKKISVDRAVATRENEKKLILRDIESALKMQPGQYPEKEVLKTARRIARTQNNDAVKKLVGEYAGNKLLIHRKKRESAFIQADIDAHNAEAPIVQQKAAALASLAYTAPKNYGKWFADFLPGADSLGIANTEYFQHMKKTIVDSMQGQGNWRANYHTPIDAHDVAMLRLMASENFWKNRYKIEIPDESKPLFKQFSKRVKLLADVMTMREQGSKAMAAATNHLQNFIERPNSGKVSDLLKIDRELQEAYHVDALLREGKSEQYTTKIEGLLERVRGGKLHLTRNDYKLLRTLVTDSASGKAYVTTKELEGMGYEPWMVPYKQEVPIMLDALLAASSDNIDRIIAESTKFLTEAGLLSAPDKFNATVAAAYLFGNVGSVGASGGSSLYNLLSLANAWQTKTNILDNPLGTTETYALALDRHTGMGIVEEMREVFDASNRAAYEKDLWAKPLLKDLVSLRKGKEKYIDHMRPSSPVRQMINKMFVGTVDREVIDTIFHEFYTKGYHDPKMITNKSDVKASMKPTDGADLQHVQLTDHLIVDGQLTALGIIADKIHKNLSVDPMKIIDNYLERVIPESKRLRNPESYDALRQFVYRRVGGDTNMGFGKLANLEQWELVKAATARIQKHDKEGLKQLALLNEAENKRNKTSFPPIEYNPWRLDTEIVTKNNAISRESGLLGGWQDADRFAGNRYSTSPHAQIEKARSSGISSGDILYSPEANYLNRYTRLENDILSRNARRRLSDKAIFSEMIGQNEAARIIKEKVIEAGRLEGGETMPWHQQLQLRVSGSDNKALMALGLVGRNLMNPMVMLASIRGTAIEQPLQQLGLSINARPTPLGVLRGMQDAAKHMRHMFPGWYKGMFNSLIKDTETLSHMANGENIKVTGKHIAILENLYAGATKRVDPYTQAVMAEMNRGGGGRGTLSKSTSLSSATGKVWPEAIQSRIMWAVKEKAENTAVRTTLQTLGGIMETGEKVLADKGDAALAKYLSGFLGSNSNPTLILDSVRLIKEGRIDLGWETFGREYIASRVGTWNHSNIPKGIRSAARILPGADQFYTAATIGTYRLINSFVGIENMPPATKARLIASAVAMAGIASGLGYMQAESGVDWFQRISPISWFSGGVNFAMSESGKKPASVSSMLSTLGTRAELRSGASHSQMLRALYSFVKVADDVYLADTLKERNTVDMKKDPMREFLLSLLDMTFVKPAMSTTFHTPQELANALNYQLEPLAYDGIDMAAQMTTMTGEDAAILAASITGRFDEAQKLSDKLIEIETTNGESPFKTEEELTIAVLGLWARAMEHLNDKAWEATAPEGFRKSDDPRATAPGADRLKIFVQGLQAGSPAAVAITRMTESAIARYERRKAKNAALISGSEIPTADKIGDWRNPPVEPEAEGKGEAEGVSP